jgi:hypothetical protein
VDVPLSTSTALATRNELFSANEQLALAGFLAGYSGLTRDAYTLDLRQCVAWCTEHPGGCSGPVAPISSASPATSSSSVRICGRFGLERNARSLGLRQPHRTRGRNDSSRASSLLSE